jgi:hypothetical protein
MPNHIGRNNVQKGRLKVEIDMKFAMKSLVVASILAATGAANAAIVTANAGTAITVTDPAGSGRKAEITLLSTSSGALTFSVDDHNPDLPYDPSDSATQGGLIAALNAGKIGVTGVNSTYTETTFTDGTGIRNGGTAKGFVTAVTANDQTGQILTVLTPAGAKQSGTAQSGVSTGGTAQVGNLRIDLTNTSFGGVGVVFADLSGTNLATKTKAATTITLNGEALWFFDAISGPTSIKPSSLLAADPVAALGKDGYTNIKKLTDARGTYYTADANNAITGLHIVGGTTGTAFNFFKNSLGLLTQGSTALANVADWGRLDSSLQVQVREIPVIPEPSTYAMMGLGLVGLAAAARRRAK